MQEILSLLVKVGKSEGKAFLIAIHPFRDCIIFAAFGIAVIMYLCRHYHLGTPLWTLIVVGICSTLYCFAVGLIARGKIKKRYKVYGVGTAIIISVLASVVIETYLYREGLRAAHMEHVFWSQLHQSIAITLRFGFIATLMSGTLAGVLIVVEPYIDRGAE